MPLVKKLQQLNVPEREAQVYVALLKSGLTRVGPIVTKTKLHRMLVYQALENLKDMRLASMVVKNGRQHWQVTNPSVILERVQKQEELAQELVKEIEDMRKVSEDDVSVQIFYGRLGLIENLEMLLRSAGATDKIMRIIGGTSDVDLFNLIGDWYPEYQALQQRLGVSKHLIAPEGHSRPFERLFPKVAGNESRLMKEGLSNPTFTRITPEIVSIEIYGSSEPVIIQLRNKSIAKAYVDKFNLLWEAAKNQ